MDEDVQREPPIERFLRERAGLLVVAALLGACLCIAIGLFGRGQNAGAAFCPAVLLVLASFLPAWFLIRRWIGSSLTCHGCGTALRRRGGSTPAWYDADQVDYRCNRCKNRYCGKCATSVPAGFDSLQDLKAKYGASGVALKRAIDDDPQALYEKGELDPVCPSCERSLFQTGTVL